MFRSLLIGYKTFSDLLGRLCSFGVVLLAARLLSKGDFGLFALAWAGGWIVAVASDFGLQILLTREVARQTGEVSRVFRQFLRLRLGLAAGLFVLVLFLTRLVGWPSESLAFFFIVLSQIISSLIEFQNHLYRGLERSDLESTLNLAHRILALILAGILLLWQPKLGSLALALLAASTVSAVVAAWLSGNLLAGFSDKESPNRETPRIMASDFVPIGLGVLLSALYFRVDVFFIEELRGVENVASYSSVFRIVDGLRLFPAAVLAVVFPDLCRREGFRTFVYSLFGLLALSIVIVLGGLWQADLLVSFLYGKEYLTSIETFRILLLSLPALYVNFLLTHQMIGWNLHISFASLCLAGLILTTILNWALIPLLGIEGSALACVVREVVLTGMSVLVLIRSFQGPLRLRSPMADFPKLSAVELATLKTVCYASVFDYPLTLEELATGLIDFRTDTDSLWEAYQQSHLLHDLVEFQDGYFFLKGQSHFLNCRNKRESHSRRRLTDHRRILRLICAIPFTRLVALSGGAAHLNLQADGDIDLFIITRGRFVWAVAVTTLLMAKMFRKRKMICFNYLISDENLKLAKADLFGANQLINLRRLMGRNSAAQLIEHNPFACDYYPNFEKIREAAFSCTPRGFWRILKSIMETLLAWGPGQLFEVICRVSYRWYLMRTKPTWATPEEVILSPDVIKVHTRGHRQRVYELFNSCLSEALARIQDS